jgi:hypothetical protein
MLLTNLSPITFTIAYPESKTILYDMLKGDESSRKTAPSIAIARLHDKNCG